MTYEGQSGTTLPSIAAAARMISDSDVRVKKE